jgi:hypothetical protein
MNGCWPSEMGFKWAMRELHTLCHLCQGNRETFIQNAPVKTQEHTICVFFEFFFQEHLSEVCSDCIWQLYDTQWCSTWM